MTTRLFRAAWFHLPIALFCLLSAPGSAQPPTVLPHFVDVTDAAGIAFQHSFGDETMSNIVESSGSGCAFLDYDGDGWLDLYLLSCGPYDAVNEGPSSDSDRAAHNVLYRNNGDGTFTDVTDAAGCGDTGFSMGVVVGDYDGDGDPDIYVTNAGPNTLYRNNGDGAFTDVTQQAGVGDARIGIGCAMLDYDGDADLDLYVGNYLEYDPEYHLFFVADEFPGPLAYGGQTDVLYRNNGDGTFTDVTEPAGLLNESRTMGVLAADFDGDGRVDIFVANDAMENFLYHNNGDGTFTDVALTTGVAFSANGDATSSMGGDFGDFDNDGDLDLLVPDMSFSNLYRQTAEGFFEDVTAASGLAEACGQYVSWGGDFGDFNNDGFVDILISNGDAHRLDTMESLLLINVPGSDGGRRFQNLGAACGPWLRQKAVSRGMAVGDYDNDGDLDLFVVNLDQPSRLIRNDGKNLHWLTLDLEGTVGNRDALGARVTVRAGDLLRMEEKQSSSSYLSQNDPRLHFGLGAHTVVDEIEIRWPGGGGERLEKVGGDRILKIVEGEAGRGRR